MAAAANIEQWTMLSKDLKSDLDLTTEELLRLLDLADDMKRNPQRYTSALSNRYLTLLFEKPSLRTRMTFEVAIQQLGGGSILNIGPIGDREPLKDIARNVERWTQAIVARVYSQQTIDDLAKWASAPVINALSDLYHPCQALADFQTIRERFGDFRGLKLVFAGDGNNVAHSLMLDAARLGVHFTIACPVGYEPNAKILEQSRAFAAHTGATVTVTNDPMEAARGANIIYTDVWASMGQEHEADKRRGIFMPYQVNAALMETAGPEAVFMHCLPAKRGLEVTDGVMEMPHSAVFDQAENRLHTQKALLLMLLS